MLMLNTSNSHYHQDFELLQLQHMLPGVGRNLFKNYLLRLGLLQARLRRTSMATLAG